MPKLIPGIFRKRCENASALYGIVLYFSLFQGLAIAIPARTMVYLLHGAAYESLVGVLRQIVHRNGSVGIGFVMPSLKKNNELLLRGANPNTALQMLGQFCQHTERRLIIGNA